jgi:hypothetical protein
MNVTFDRIALALAACLVTALPAVGAHADVTSASISGSVMDKDSKAPVSGATVAAYDEESERPEGTTLTDASGRFVVSVSPGWIVLVLSHPRYFTAATLAVRVPNDSPVTMERPINLYNSSAQLFFRPGAIAGLEPVSGSQWQESVPSTGPALLGRVERSNTHASLAGAIVAAYIAPYPDARAAAVTDAGGRFAILGLHSGTYTLRVTAGAFSPQIIDDASVDETKRVSLSKPIQLEAAVKVLFRDGLSQLCGGLVHPGQTADVYIVCGW